MCTIGVILLLVTALARCCGAKVCGSTAIAYDSSTQVCCGDEVHDKEGDMKCCGGEWVAKKTHACFFGFIPYRKMKSCYGFHLRQHYDPETEICCDKTAHKKTPTLDCCCKLILYNPTISVCDEKNLRVIPKQNI